MKSDKVAVVDRKQDPDAPPAFSEYKAETKKEGSDRDDIYSHDPHINSDGEALYRFLLDQQTQHPPVLRILIKGSRYETTTGTSYQNSTEFIFHVDVPLSAELANERVHYSLADSEPAYRGDSAKEIEVKGEKKPIGFNDFRNYNSQRDARAKKGVAPWCVDVDEKDLPVLQQGKESEYVEKLQALHARPWKSSRSLREWADDYCSKTSSRREFAFQQDFYGWDLEKLENIMCTAIKEKFGYTGDVTLEFWTVHSKIFARPPGTVSKVLSKIWHGGLSVWKIAGVAYPLTKWVPVEKSSSDSTPSSQFVKTSTGFQKRIGMTEEGWFKKWESTIAEAVNKKLDTCEFISCPI
ncbi:hypothetical protein FA15DRAFT_698887 [Coprinopsis marcescibilis]|uniref:Uncharacterized protein n=1 Tax=Coprinopsis marcescibilis TaxID=230819 RepID=A0A5C3LES3_COPMA|nr:hypothetical protein FA15DRAFT_698887 [Coprinopsis marcescibilis]